MDKAALFTIIKDTLNELVVEDEGETYELMVSVGGLNNKPYLSVAACQEENRDGADVMVSRLDVELKGVETEFGYYKEKWPEEIKKD